MLTTQERSVWPGWQKYTDFIRLLGSTLTLTLSDWSQLLQHHFQVELNLQDVELLAHNGNIKRSDFIEYALETKGGFQKDKITSKIHDYLVQGEQLLLFTT